MITIQDEHDHPPVKPQDKKTLEKKTQYRYAFQDDHVQDKSVQDKHFEDQSVQDTHNQDQSVQDTHIKDQYLPDEHIQDQSIQNKHVQDHSYQDENVIDLCVHDEHIQDQSVQNKHVQDQSLPDENVKAAAIQHQYVSVEQDTITSEAEKKENMICICKTLYDESKSYVSCNICEKKFHCTCVNVTSTIVEYTCPECCTEEDRYCFCRQPNDESHFYIGCDKCFGWFHGHCVGILQSEAKGIEDYECSACNPDHPINKANLMELDPKSYDMDTIKELLKSVQSSQYSTSFRKPMNKKRYRSFYEIVKEPMDLETIEKRLGEGKYTNLASFLGDLTRITEGARYYFSLNSTASKHAEKLESFIAARVQIIRQKLLQK